MYDIYTTDLMTLSLSLHPPKEGQKNGDKKRIPIYVSYVSNLLTRELIFLSPKPILVYTQVSSHYFAPCISHSIYKKAPCWTQCSNEKISFSCHQEVDKGVVCTGYSTKLCFIGGHRKVSYLTLHICVVKFPGWVTYGFINHFLGYIIDFTWWEMSLLMLINR